MSKKNTIRLTESELKTVITESVKNVLKERFNSPLPSFAAKEVEPKHRLRKQWDDDYDAMVARNHARGEEFMDDFNKKANLSYGKSLKEGYDDNPPTGYEIFFNLGEQYANTVFKELSSKYRNNVDVEVIEHIIDGFEAGLWAFAQVGDEYANIRGFGIRQPRGY